MSSNPVAASLSNHEVGEIVNLEVAFEEGLVTLQVDLVIVSQEELEIVLQGVPVIVLKVVLETVLTEVLVIVLIASLETALTGRVVAGKVHLVIVVLVTPVIALQAGLAACIACIWPLTNKNQ